MTDLPKDYNPRRKAIFVEFDGPYGDKELRFDGGNGLLRKGARGTIMREGWVDRHKYIVMFCGDATTKDAVYVELPAHWVKVVE